MSDEMYAITETSFRLIAAGDALFAGETAVSELPENLRLAISMARARNDRDSLLRACDWTQIVDAPMSTLEKTQWLTYRQALRDLPALPGFPDVPWPVPPTLPAGAAQSGV
jgi:hypothetical protein